MGLRQVVMALMNWAIDVPLELNKVMQYPLSLPCFTPLLRFLLMHLLKRAQEKESSSGGINYLKKGNKVELIMKYSYLY